MDWLKVIDGLAGITKTVGIVTGNPMVAGVAGAIEQYIDSDNDNEELLNELSTEKLLILRQDIDKILYKR